MKAPLAIAIAIAATSAACATPVDERSQLVRVADILPLEHRAVDVLFVIDDSVSMTPEQDQLGIWSSELFDVLSLDAELPDLHLGVISSSLVIDLGGCSDVGDGRLHAGSGQLVSGNFISDVSDGEGGRITNYTGTINDAFADIAKVGAQGCGFEQPFAAVERALDGTHAENDGFLRDEALLLVVIVSDEDDCSVIDPAIFGELDGTGELGPLSSFRCFEHGVECAGDDPRTFGEKSECRPREQSPYVAALDPFVDFLRSRKDHPGKVLVAGIFGQADLVSVVPSNSGGTLNGSPSLGYSCSSELGEAFPGVRYNALLQAFPNRSAFSSICEADLSWAMRNSGRAAKAVATRSPCLAGAIADVDPVAAGVQSECRVAWASDVGSAGERVVEIPRCDRAGGGDCYTIDDDPSACPETPSGLAVSTTGDVGGTLYVDCRVDGL